jgi:FG-GAP-like repeat/FG-GAP repeat
LRNGRRTIQCFGGGASVAIGDINHDGVTDIITGAGAGGGPHVRIFSATLGTLEGQFFAYDAAFSGGVWVATGNINGIPGDEIITGAGAGGGPHVRIFTGMAGALYDEYFAYGAAYRGGVMVAAADITGDGSDDVITGAQQQGGPHVRVFGSHGLVLEEFMAFSTTFTNGIRVSTSDINGDGRPDILVGNGPGMQSDIRAFSGTLDHDLLTEFHAFDPDYTGGVFVG